MDEVIGGNGSIEIRKPVELPVMKEARDLLMDPAKVEVVIDSMIEAIKEGRQGWATVAVALLDRWVPVQRGGYGGSAVVLRQETVNVSDKNFYKDMVMGASVKDVKEDFMKRVLNGNGAK